MQTVIGLKPLPPRPAARGSRPPRAAPALAPAPAPASRLDDGLVTFLKYIIEKTAWDRKFKFAAAQAQAQAQAEAEAAEAEAAEAEEEEWEEWAEDPELALLPEVPDLAEAPKTTAVAKRGTRKHLRAKRV